MGLFDRLKKKNAIQINEVGQTMTCSPFVFPHKSGAKPLGEVYVQTLMNILYKGISNVTLKSTRTDSPETKIIIDFIDSNSALLLAQYVRLGYICVFYDDEFHLRVPNDSEIRMNSKGEVVNRYAIAYYSPQYATERKSLLKIILPLVAEIDKLAGTESYLADTLGAFGILSGSDIPINPEGKKRLLESLKEDYGSLNDRYNFFLSNHDMTYTPIQPDIKGLEFSEKIKNHYKTLANIFGVPLPLIFDDQSTYNNVKEARLYFYDTTIRHYAEILLKVARELLTASNVFIPQNSLTYFLSNIPELEKTLSSACEERTALLDYLIKLRDAGVDTSKEINDLYNESKFMLSEI